MATSPVLKYIFYELYDSYGQVSHSKSKIQCESNNCTVVLTFGWGFYVLSFCWRPSHGDMNQHQLLTSPDLKIRKPWNGYFNKLFIRICSSFFFVLVVITSNIDLWRIINVYRIGLRTWKHSTVPHRLI